MIVRHHHHRQCLRKIVLLGRQVSGSTLLEAYATISILIMAMVTLTWATKIVCR